jgi:dihydrodipicolinate synthase/N-acetylneuraminate lyase
MTKRYPAAMLAPCLLPWSDRYELDADLFAAEVRALRSGLTPHLYLFGTAGEGHAVTDRQFREIVRLFRGELGDDHQAMVGVIALSLGSVIERIELGRELGFHAFQVSLPAWGELTDGEVDVFFRETCGRFPDAKFLHYNLRRAKRLLTGQDYARLAAAHPNLVAVKMGGEDTAALTEILVRAPELQCFFTEFGYAAVRDAHECGYLVALGAMNFARAHRHFAARGEALAASRDTFREVHRAVKNAMAGCGAHMDGAYDKLYARARNPQFPLRLLPPYASSTEQTFTEFCRALPAGWRS